MNFFTNGSRNENEVQNNVAEKQTGGGEPQKRVASKMPWVMIFWYFWTLGPCLVTAALLGINYSGYIIGTNLGNSIHSQAIILAVIQGFGKINEVMMVIGLVNIVQQAIQRSLLKDGILLGLLGAELSLGNAFLIISQEFRAAFGYGISKWGEQKKVFFLAAFISAVSLLSLAVGPASTVLMDPEIGWFLERKFAWYTAADHEGAQYLDNLPPLCYPYILIDPRLGGATDISEISPFSVRTPDYWGYSMYGRNHSDIGVWDIDSRQVTHQFIDMGLSVTVNSSTTFSRPLSIDKDWKGETNFSAGFQTDAILLLASLINYHPIRKNIGSPVQFTADMTGIYSSTVCRKRWKLYCDNSTIMTSNSSDWCFKSVARDTDEGFSLQSKNLLLLSQDNISLSSSDDSPSPAKNLWMTEGPRTTNDKFTDTMVVVLDDIDDPTRLIVCSTSAKLDVVTASSDKKQFSAQIIHAHKNLYYFSPNKKTASVPPPTILYHENWLDMIYHDVPLEPFEHYPRLINNTYPVRNASRVTPNPNLNAWAVGIQDVQITGGGSQGIQDESDGEAGIVEIVIGGAFVTMLSRLYPSSRQYSTSLEWYYDGNRSVSTVENYPAELMPEQIIDCQYINKTLNIYRLVYGYNGMSIDSILSAVVLLLYVFIAIAGSLKQFQEGRIIQAWNTVPQYIALGLGSDLQKGMVENTCAGIESGETLKTLMGVRVSATDADHLELIKAPLDSQPMYNLEKKYGVQQIGGGQQQA